MISIINTHDFHTWSEKHYHIFTANYKGIHEDLTIVDQLLCHKVGSSSLSLISIYYILSTLFISITYFNQNLSTKFISLLIVLILLLNIFYLELSISRSSNW